MVATRSIKWILSACLLLTSCRGSASDSLTSDSAPEGTPLPETTFLTPAPPTEAPPMPGISAEQVRNAKYQLGFTDALRIVQLTDGAYVQGAPGDVDYMEVHVTDFIGIGDIDGDGVNEAAALIAESYGGSGTFVFLALYAQKDNAPEFITAVYVDDRPVIDGVGFENNQVFLYTTTHSKDDRFCCPTFKNERHYRLVDNQLDLANFVSYTADGRQRVIDIESPADGTEVFRSVPLKGNVTVAPFENNLVYRIYDLGGVELAVGSVTVNANELGGPGTFDTQISLGNILSGALIRIELQDLSVEDGSLLAMDSVELVVK